MRYFVLIEGERLEVEVSNGQVTVDGAQVEVELAAREGDSPVRSARVENRSLRVLPRRTAPGQWSFEMEGVRYRAEVLDPGDEAIRSARSAAGAATGPAPLKAPMPGMVMRVEVAVGDVVVPGQGVVIVEAMKMENELKASAAARVKAIHAVAGTAVEKDQILVEFEAEWVEG